jgi:glycosyltransferase involved in cell wall biosynthesis
MAALKILVLTHCYPRYAGDSCAPFVKDLCEAHAQAGCEVRVVAPYDTDFAADAFTGPVELMTYRYAPRERWHLLGYSRTLDRDVRLKSFVWPLAPLLAVAGVRALFRQARQWRPDVIHAHWALPSGWIASIVAKHLNIPLFVTLHGSDVFVAERNVVFRTLARQTGLVAQRITSCSPELAQRLVALGVPEQKLVLVPNGTDPAYFYSNHPDAGSWRTRWLGVSAGNARLIVALGRCVPKKGFDQLVAALPDVFARYPDSRCIIAGGGPDESMLRACVAAAGMSSRVHFPGAIEHSAVPGLLAAADIVVVPSVRDEAGNIDGLPVVVLEAMSAGKPVVATALAGIPLAVDHHVTGMLCAPGDSAALAQALNTLLADDSKRRDMGNQGRAKVVESLNWNAISARHRKLYSAALYGDVVEH